MKRVKHYILASLLIVWQCVISANAGNEALETKESYAVDQNGNIYPVECRLLDTNVNSTGDSFSQTFEYELTVPSEIHSMEPVTSVNWSDTTTGNDSTYCYRATLTVKYDIVGTTYKLTNVSGSYLQLDSMANLISRHLIYGCSAVNFITQRGEKTNFLTPFSYNTGFTQYVADNGGSQMGAILTLTIKRGGSTWKFVLKNMVLSSSLDF